MGRRGGLGRGLGALIPPPATVADGAGDPVQPSPGPHDATEPAGPVDPSTTAEGTGLREVPIDAVRPNPRQPRTSFDEGALEELASSIRLLGVLQPILVRPEGDHYELVAGERRWRAAQRAGLRDIPALVRTVDDRTSVEHALVENLQRADLGPLDEAAAYHQLMEDFDLSQEQVADRVGKSRSAVANTLRLLRLAPEVLALLDAGQLTAGHARALLGLDDPALQVALAELAASQGWSVRRTEEEVRRREAAATPPTPRRPAGPANRAPALLELEHLLSDHLDTRVQVSLTRKRGRVVIDFGSIEDLERIYRAMVQGREGDADVDDQA